MATGACSAGAITGGVVVVANDSSKEDEVVDNIKYTICGIIASPLFDKKDIQQRSLKVIRLAPDLYLSWISWRDNSLFYAVLK